MRPGRPVHSNDQYALMPGSETTYCAGRRRCPGNSRAYRSVERSEKQSLHNVSANTTDMCDVILTEEDPNQREDDELRDDEESEVTRDDGAVESGVRVRAHVLREPPHEDGQHITE